MNNIFEEEKKHLDYTKRVIDEEIEKNKESEEELKKASTKLSFEDRLRGTHLNLNSQLFDVGKRVYNLQKSKSCPYFGRIDYQRLNADGILTIYIGKNSISHNNNPVVYDWRSPICGLYYDSELGNVSYESPEGIQNGNLLLKRQIIIENGELINAVDTNLVTNDELLFPYLNANSDNKMKTIISTIQKEQNSIIRSEDNDIIIQGVAGSGKTSVALHRIAYLIYNLGNKYKSNDFLVIGPNNYFLNYISSVLPELETSTVKQQTLLNFMNEYLETDLTLCPEILPETKKKRQMQINISKFKSSLEFRDLLDKFMLQCCHGDKIVTNDFCIDGKVVYSADIIRERLFGEHGNHLDFDKTRKYFKSKFKEDINEIYSDLNREYRQIYTSLPKGDPVREEAVKKSVELDILVKKQGEKLLDKYFKEINKSCLALYVLFISELDQMETNLTPEEIRMLQKDTLKLIRKKQIAFEDISALLYLNYIISNKKTNYNHIVIDEAQDYSLFTYYTMKKIFENAIFNIYGDIAQALYPYRSINSWDELNKNIFEDKCRMLELSKSYRTTIEITEASNNILKSIGVNESIPVIRHGSDVQYLDNQDDENIKENKICDWIDRGYKTIAVICKDELEAQRVNEELIGKGINSTYISNKDNRFDGGVFVLTVASAKGLEFDCTIINDASSDVYDENNAVDMHLLYVASTRALHEQVVLYNKTITKPFQTEIKKNMVLKKTK